MNNKKDFLNKTIVIGIIFLFVGTGFVQAFGGNSDTQEMSSLTFYTFDKSGTRKCKVELPIGVVEDISCLFEELKKGITIDPFGVETDSLKNRFVEKMDVYGLIPEGLSRDDVFSLLNPGWNSRVGDNIPLSRIRDGVLPAQYSNRGSAFFCSMAGGGSGMMFPPIMLPRPRLATVWATFFYYSGTIASNIYTGHGFAAIGPQIGMALGFWGIGLSFAFPGYPSVFGFGGYALAASVMAAYVENYPPNHVPVVSEENPSDGSVDVPNSLSELSFRISDDDGDRMSYSVTTSPYIGAGSGSNVVGGTYSIPVSGLNSDTLYSWTVRVSDQEDISERTFSFRTAVEAPYVSDPFPLDGDDWVPVDFSELSFRLEDFQGDLMDYTVETVPDIGSASGVGVGDGVYSVPVSGVEYTRDYVWFVNVTDGEFLTRRVFSFKTQPILVFDPFDEGWGYRKQITINHSMVAWDLSDFPVLISIVDSDLSEKAQVDGDDILFMDGSGVANRLFHEVESYDGSSGELVCWLNVPSLSSSEDFVLFLYYGNSGCGSQEYPARVWDSDYIAVYHLDGDEYLDIDDSTSNNLDVVEKQGDPTFQVSGKIGFCVDFDDASLNVADNDLLSFTEGSNQDKPFTIEAWVKFDKAGSDDNGIISKYANRIREWLLRKTSDDICDLRICDDSTEVTIWRETSSKINVNNNDWNYISATYNGHKTGYDIEMMLDGTINNGEAWTSPSYYGTENLNEKMRIGAYHSHQTGWHYWQGLIDEVRISNIARSPEWLTTSYNTMYDPSSFFIIGSEESAP